MGKMILKENVPVGLCSDHAGFETKQAVMRWLDEQGIAYKDFGTYNTESCDYPDFAHQVGSALEKGEYKRGIVICGSGNGVQMTVNKYPHVRCALCWTPEIAHLGRQHNDCNCISMPARFISEETALQIVDEYLNTEFEGGRHQRRVEKISQIKF